MAYVTTAPFQLVSGAIKLTHNGFINEWRIHHRDLLPGKHNNVEKQILRTLAKDCLREG